MVGRSRASRTPGNVQEGSGSSIAQQASSEPIEIVEQRVEDLRRRTQLLREEAQLLAEQADVSWQLYSNNLALYTADVCAYIERNTSNQASLKRA